ncbi:threonine ammonia-lyase [bacterium]|nr:threonine ammonia-lyase [bacterium]
MPISLKDILEARVKIKDVVLETPLSHSQSASDLLGCQVYLKMENQQRTGSFKIRGSLNKMLSLTEEERARGVIASSAGNHAQGVAFSASHLKTKSIVVMPETAPLVKVIATRGYGAEVVLSGRVYDEAFQKAQEILHEKGLTFIHPYNDPMIMAGQGTIGVELMEALPDLDSVIVPIGGGGLISGVAMAMKSINPKVKVFGVVSEVSPGMMQIFGGKPVELPEGLMTIADGISVKKPNEQILNDYIKPYVDDIVAVSDNEIAESIVFFLERAKTVVEGSGAVVLAGALKAGWDLGKKTVLLLSGGNIDLNLISKVIERGLTQKGRLVRFEAIVADRPGTLNRLSEIIALHGANIIEVSHDRVRTGLQLSETVITFLLETKSDQHCRELVEAVKKSGVKRVLLNSKE